METVETLPENRRQNSANLWKKNAMIMMSEMNQMPAPPVLSFGRNAEQIAFTFDDGPNDPHTLEILDLLEEYKAKATFFLLGKWALLRTDIVRKIYAAGHAIGNHSQNHLPLKNQPSDLVVRELQQCQDAIANAIGVFPGLFRPPLEMDLRRSEFQESHGS